MNCVESADLGTPGPRVLHVITGLRRGGAEGVLTRLIAATRQEIDHVVVSLSDAGHFGPLLREQGTRVHALDIHPRFGAVSGTARLANLIRRERPNIVQTWLYHADLIGGAAAWLAKVRPVVWGVRNNNLDAASIGTATRLVARASAMLSGALPDVILCNSHAASRAHIAFGYRPDRFRIIENGFDTERFRPEPELRTATRRAFGIAPTEFLIGMVARWDRQKDQGNLISAVSLLADAHPELRLLLVGTGMDHGNTDLERLLRAAGVTERVILAGPRDDVPAVMNALDLHVQSSMGEAFPNALAEAMACGTACVVTDVGDSSRIIGDTGWVAPPRDSIALASAIESALNAVRDQGRMSVGSRCRQQIIERFSLARMTAAYLSLWRELCARPEPRAR